MMRMNLTWAQVGGILKYTRPRGGVAKRLRHITI